MSLKPITKQDMISILNKFLKARTQQLELESHIHNQKNKKEVCS